jgi:predicted Ser/Thr protein kinase
MFFETVSNFTKDIVKRFKEGIELVPIVWRKPKVLRYWLKNSQKAHIAIIVLIVLVPFILIPLMHSLLSFVFSPVTEEAFFGLIRTKKDNPFLEYAQLLVTVLVWLTSFLICIYLFLIKIPDVIQHSRKVVKDKIAEADKTLVLKPAEGVLLYNAATEWNVDEDYEKIISTKMDNINKTVFDDLDKTLINMTPGMVSPRNREPVETVVADRYPIKKLLGKGAMGSVYLAEDLRLKREIALKMLAPGLSIDEHLLARFRQEALALARLSHPNIVQVYDFFEENGFFWIAMEFVKGGELDARLKASGRLELHEALAFARQMADALGYAHEQGVIHRDFKPANVLLTPNANVKITDFGIAKLAQSSIHTQLNTVLGTPSYMSPEQANGETTDHRTDIYSLGIVFYQLLAGELPFKGDHRSIIAQHFLKEVPRLSEFHQDISPEIDLIIQKMLAKKPADRYQSMLEVMTELDHVSKQV